MKDLSTVPGIGSDANFLNGDIVNNQTQVDNLAHQDPLQFFQKLMDLASLSPNGNFDNEANGYQLIDALKSYKQEKTRDNFDNLLKVLKL